MRGAICWLFIQCLFACDVELGMLNAMRSCPGGMHAEGLMRMSFFDYFSLPYSRHPDSVYFANTSLLNISFRALSGSSQTINTDETGALDAAIDFFIKGQGAALLGPGTSAQAVVTQTLAKLLGAATISYAATSPDLSDKILYPTFMRTISSDSFQARTLVDLCVHYGWSSVGLIYTTDSYGAAGANAVSEYAQQQGITIAGKAAFTKNNRNVELLSTSLAALKSSRVRVFIMILVYQDGLFALSVAKGLGITGPGFVYIFADSVTGSAMGGNGVDMSGSLGVQMASVTSGAVYEAAAARWLNFNVPGIVETDFNGLVSNGYYNYSSTEASPLNYTYHTGFPARGEYSYDSVTMLLTAVEALARNGSTPCTMSLGEYRRLLTQTVRQTIFSGISGLVALDENGDRNGTYEIFNLQNVTEWVKIGTWSSTDLNITVEPRWSNGEIGRTRAPPAVILPAFRSPADARAVGPLLAVALLCFIIVNIILLYRFRNTFTIKCSSPKFVFLINLGGALVSCSALAGFPTTDPLTCSLEPILGHLGFSLVFGPLLAKTWRIRGLFLQGSKKLRIDTRKYHDKRLLARVMMLFLGVAVYLAVWRSQIFQPVIRVVGDRNGDTYYYLCAREPVYMGVLYGLEAILLVMGLIFSIQIRKITDAYNESRSIVTSIYAIAFIALVVLPVVYGAVTDPDVSYILSSLAICTCVATVLGLLLVPKFHIVLTGKDDAYRDENMGGHVSTNSHVRSSSGPAGIPENVQEMLRTKVVSVNLLLNWVETSEHKAHAKLMTNIIAAYPRANLLEHLEPSND